MADQTRFDSKARGVAILISKNFQFIPSETISNPNGRYIIVRGSLFHMPVILVNV